MDESTRAEQSTRLLRRLFKGLENRKALLGGAGRTRLDEHLVDLLGQLAAVHCEDRREELDAPPPRAVSLALSLAVSCQPHCGLTFTELLSEGTEALPRAGEGAADPPMVVPTDLLEEAMGLPGWELDDLREEIDLRTGRLLKRARAAQWLWTRFHLPEAGAEPLFRVLFPGTPSRMGTVGLLRRGAQLYAVVEQEPAPDPASLYLSWLDHDEELTYAPLGTFQGRYVDPGLRRALARGVGADDDEIVDILDHMITIVPRTGVEAFLARDLWRASARGVVCGLAADYASPGTLVAPLRPDEVEVEGWIALREGKLAVRNLRRTLDSLLLPRVTHMAQLLYAHLLADLLVDPARPLGLADLELVDLGAHIRAVAAPVLDWTRSRRAAGHLAAHFGVDAKVVVRLLEAVRTSWIQHLEAVWLGPPREGQPLSVQALLCVHLVATSASLRDVLAREPLGELPHGDVALLFAGHYLASAPLQRLWSGTREDGSPSVGQTMGPDPVGRWFWRAWRRLVTYVDVEPIMVTDDMETFSM